MSGKIAAYLFVYGTLMSHASRAAIGGDERRLLHASATSLGAATVAGRLYDLGSYPGLVTSPDAADRVHGEVLELADPERLFARLDPYEGIDPARPDGGDYRRDLRPARLADGRELMAWVYVFRGPVAGCPRLADGRWRV